MYSRVIPLEELAQHSVMYFLPFGGRDNGVWADTWVILADIETDDVTAVLGLLAEADVGAYAAICLGQNGRTDGRHHLYVDTMSYTRAEDVLMLFLRAKGPTTRNETPTPHSRAIGRLRIKDAIGRAISILIGAAGIAVALAFAYYAGPTFYPCVHPGPHHLPAATHQIA